MKMKMYVGGHVYRKDVCVCCMEYGRVGKAIVIVVLDNDSWPFYNIIFY